MIRPTPKSLSEGASDWPYQVAEISLVDASDAALRPAGFDPALELGLENTKTHCLTCHKVNGYGGEKVEGNLALVVRGLGEVPVRQMGAGPAGGPAGHDHARTRDADARVGAARDRRVDLRIPHARSHRARKVTLTTIEFPARPRRELHARH